MSGLLSLSPSLVLAELPVWAQLAILFVFTDFCVYLWLRLRHESRIVWQFHKAHHSSLKPHLDRSYGGVLAIWDHLFGTWAPRGDLELVYGLVDERLPEDWLRQQTVPVIGLWRLARNRTPAARAAGPAS